jgi:hypothetical protein
MCKRKANIPATAVNPKYARPSNSGTATHTARRAHRLGKRAEQAKARATSKRETARLSMHNKT